METEFDKPASELDMMERSDEHPVKIYWAVQVNWGREVPEGHLPVFSTVSEEEAKQIVIATCELGTDGEYYARELAEEQTIENLRKFSDRLAEKFDIIQGHLDPSEVL